MSGWITALTAAAMAVPGLTHADPGYSHHAVFDAARTDGFYPYSGGGVAAPSRLVLDHNQTPSAVIKNTCSKLMWYPLVRNPKVARALHAIGFRADSPTPDISN